MFAGRVKGFTEGVSITSKHVRLVETWYVPFVFLKECYGGAFYPQIHSPFFEGSFIDLYMAL